MAIESNLNQLIAQCATLVLSLALSACSKDVNSQGLPGALPVFNEPRQVSLSLVGYNYTNRYINEFSVGGEGGGNLYVSSPAGGGGGTVCCAKYWPGVKGYKVNVRWQTGACYYKVRASDSNEVRQRLFPFFKEAEVEVDERATDRARYMEVHFYPDGSVQVAATEHPSPPRLVLDREREDNTRYPRCPNDDKPGQ